MSYRLGVDLGTTFTAAACANGRGPALLALGNRALQVPSVLYLDETGNFVVGEAAERRGAVAPERLVREFKRRLGDHVPVLLAGAAFSPENLMAQLLRWVVRTSTRQFGEAPDEVVLTHPANWGPYKLELFDQVAAIADVGATRRMPEPVAAAAQYAANAHVETGDRIAVYDLGGGTFDVCILERTAAGFELLGEPDGIEHLGGVDFDEAIFRMIWSGLGVRTAELDFDDYSTTVAVARLRRDVIEAKEALSTDAEAVVPINLPGLMTTYRVTRPEFEALIRPAIDTTAAALRRAVRSAALQPDQLQGIVLVGGSSRIPLVSEVLQREFRLPIAVDTHPKHDTVLGAVLVGSARVDAPSSIESAWSPSTPAQTMSTPQVGPVPKAPVYTDMPGSDPVGLEVAKARARNVNASGVTEQGVPRDQPPVGVEAVSEAPPPQPADAGRLPGRVLASVLAALSTVLALIVVAIVVVLVTRLTA